MPLKPAVIAISRPSGDQSRSLTFAPVVTCWRSDPSLSMIQMSSAFVKAIRAPSGDQVGLVSELEVGVVRRVCPLPSAFIT